MGAEERTLAQRVTTYSTALYAGLIVLAGVLLMSLTVGWSWFAGHASLKAIANELGGLLVVTGGLAILWELRGKRDLIREVLEKVRLSTEVQAAGISQVTMNWMDVPWEDYFRNAKEIDVFISYGNTWRNNHWTKLEDFAGKKRNKLRVYLPDPNDEPTMRVLALRYGYTVEKIRSNVMEMATEMAKLSGLNSADIRIYFRAGDPTYTCYRFDDKALITLYSHKRLRGNIPTIAVVEGSFKEFFMDDLAAIHKQSVEVALADLQEDGQ